MPVYHQKKLGKKTKEITVDDSARRPSVQKKTETKSKSKSTKQTFGTATSSSGLKTFAPVTNSKQKISKRGGLKSTESEPDSYSKIKIKSKNGKVKAKVKSEYINNSNKKVKSKAKL